MENSTDNRYPLFAGGRILKKEALWDLRDYAYESMQLSYIDYTDGIIKGCRIRVEGENLVIGTGILKFGDFIYLLKEETAVPFTAENRLVVLKAAFNVKQNNPDYLVYQITFFMDPNPERQENQIELCRFHLRTGSVLRDIYKDFRDMQTEYDTVNLLHTTIAGRNQNRLHPEIMMRFAKEMQNHEKKDMADTGFVYKIWDSTGEVSRELVLAYLADKDAALAMKELYDWDNEKIVTELGNVLLNGKSSSAHDSNRNVIYID